MTSQSLILWLEQGAGARWLGRLALVLGLLTLALVVCFKQFRGPRSEETLRQLDLGRALAAGEGFTTAVRYPQVQAHQQARDVRTAADARLPEVYHPPGYALAAAAALFVLPAALRERLFTANPLPPEGFGADYAMLALNVLLLALAAVQTWALGRRLFDARTGVVAATALLLSVGVWQAVVAVDGTPLAMVGWLGLFQCLAVAETASGPRRAAAWAGAGLLLGLLFLTDYPAGILLPVVAAYAAWRGRGPALALVLVAAVLVAAPWIVRNLRVSGHPLALAAQDLALRQGDATAEPATVRATFTAEGPPVSLNKVGNKVLSHLQVALHERLWAGGGLFLTAFFLAGWMYRFRRDDATRLRALFGAALILFILAQGALNSGEAERLALTVAAPLIVVFGAGFFGVLLASNPALAARPRLTAAALLVLQGLPLLQDVLEPRQVHFSYPPYYPPVFRTLAERLQAPGRAAPVWMADVPAGAAWYAGQTVWAQPATLREFQLLHVDQPIAALVLTPATLDRPPGAPPASAGGSSRRSEWADVYRGVRDGRLPSDFPLTRSYRIAEGFHVLADPLRSR